MYESLGFGRDPHHCNSSEMKKLVIVFVLGVSLCCCDNEDAPGKLQLTRVFAGNDEISLTEPMTTGIPVDRTISLVFSSPVNQVSALGAIVLKRNSAPVTAQITFLTPASTVVVSPNGAMDNKSVYTIEISDKLKGSEGESFASTQVSFKTMSGDLTIESLKVSGVEVGSDERITDVPRQLNLDIHFSEAISTTSLQNAITLSGSGAPALQVSLKDENKTVNITSATPLKHFSKYTLTISGSLEGVDGENFDGVSKTLYTAVDENPKFPIISDEALLTLVQQQTFKYFWDFAHPVSGMARERNTSGDVVTSGGTGFALMAMIVAIERGFISRSEGIERFEKIISFLSSADRFHGAWPHWLNGTTGKVIPFSADDDGGDLVETSFLIQGLLTVREYLNPAVAEENNLIASINTLWETVEWDWYTRDGQDVLYWHWSPRVGWAMNHQIRGHNETLITYALAASSPTHAIETDVYHKGYAKEGAIVNGKTFYSNILPLGEDFGGPLFFTHYSFLGLDPRNLEDTYASYWTQNVNQTLINRSYVIDNPKDFIGYSENNWGLTASDNHQGYSAHSPLNDLGVITPTAALSSFPYTPEYSMDALKFFYYTIGDKLWGQYGFYDAFNPTAGWYADSYLAIDQGPIIIMIENCRTGLLWNLFMSAPEVQQGLTDLGFTY